MSVQFVRGWRGLALVLCAAVMFLSPASGPTAQTAPAAAPAPVAPNFDLALALDVGKVGKLVFDTSVTPRWMQTGDRFWYTYQTRDGRRFYIVDPLKKAKAPLFDHAKMAATLTVDHAPALRRAAPAVLEHQVREERRGLRVRGPGPARRRHRHDEEEDHDDAAGGGGDDATPTTDERSAAAGPRRGPRHRRADAAAQSHAALRVRHGDRARSRSTRTTSRRRHGRAG